MSTKAPQSDRPASAAAVHAVVIAFSTIEIMACLGLLTLFFVCAFTERLRRNPVLLNFSLIFALTAGGTPMLTWAGYSFDEAPPYALCLVNAGIVTGLAAAKASAAFALTCKVSDQPFHSVQNLNARTRCGLNS
jgi:hypothetical protein